MIRIPVILLVLFPLPASLAANVIHVGPAEKVSSISAAIEMAAPGDTIIVKPGTYSEGTISISKRLVLLGESRPVIDGGNKFQNVTITADSVYISGFRIVNTGTSSMHDFAGIGVEDVTGITIRNCHFQNTFFAVHVANSKSLLIENNVMEGEAKAEYQAGNGIHLWKCSRATIRNNRIMNHRDGIYFEFVTNSLIEGNLCEKNLRYGLHFMFSHHDTYKDNTFRANGAGVAVMYTNNVEMYGNHFEESWGGAAYGLLLKELTDCHIEGNHFLRNTVGILMEGTNRGNFLKNTFVGNGSAVKLQASCEGNKFIQNNFIGNTFDIVTNGMVVLNEFQYNYWDKFQGYDLNKDGIGDVPFRPVSMFAMVIDRIPEAVLLWRSFLVFLLDKTERVVPAIIPENLKDDYPRIKAYDFDKKS
jgi:nitrous oxidase accessory protein